MITTFWLLDHPGLAALTPPRESVTENVETVAPPIHRHSTKRQSINKGMGHHMAQGKSLHTIHATRSPPSPMWVVGCRVKRLDLSAHYCQLVAMVLFSSLGCMKMAAGRVYGNTLDVQDSGVKRRNSHLSNSNATFKSDSSPMEEYLYKTGIRGQKKYTLYFIILILFVIALGNIMTTFVLLGVLHLGYGMESLEFIPSERLVRFLHSANIESVIPANGILGGFDGQDLHIIGNGQPVTLQTKANRPASVVVSQDETSFINTDSFNVLDPNTGHQIFSTEYTSFGLPKAVKKLNVHQVVVNRVTSPVSQSLLLDSQTQVRMRGNEGLHMTGEEVVLTAKYDLFLKSRNASIILDAKKGVMLSVEKLPRATDSGDEEPWQYKICVCMPSGRLFQIKLLQPDYSCANVVTTGSISPCL